MFTLFQKNRLNILFVLHVDLQQKQKIEIEINTTTTHVLVNTMSSGCPLPKPSQLSFLSCIHIYISQNQTKIECE